ncbi:unnamed protein product [Tuber aestivum]|uniref:Mitochondrial import receptor subunit tom22 n=1 Tax=Tuber aestivum TaxID=59557 RepID=A0A292PVT1_9PEZI|nr:unnamed protein product [Tuber aestivum]
MVELREVEDEHFVNAQPAPSDDEDYTDTESEISGDDDDDDLDLEESFYERIAALKDMIPLKQRTYISNGFSKTYNFFSKGFTLGGKTLWILSTSALVLGVPFAVAITDEQQVVEMEKEMKMNQMTTDALTPGAESVLASPQK